ncbi:MAG: hypothetical protein AAGU27_09360 [Dehalobacterium sp.]
MTTGMLPVSGNTPHGAYVAPYRLVIWPGLLCLMALVLLAGLTSMDLLPP